MKTLKPRPSARPSPAKALAIVGQVAPHHPPATLAAEDPPTALNLRPRESGAEALTGAVLADKVAFGDISPGRGPTFSRVIIALEGAIAALRERAEAADLRLAAADRRVEQAEEALNSERARTNILRLRVDALETALTAAELTTVRETEKAARATAELATARAALRVAEAAREQSHDKALGLLARLRAALRA